MQTLAQQRAPSRVLCSLGLVVVASCVLGVHDSVALNTMDAQSARIRDLLRDSKQVPLSGLELCAHALGARPRAGLALADVLTFQGLRVRYENATALPRGDSLPVRGKSLSIVERIGNSVVLQVDGTEAYQAAKALIDAQGVRGVVPECAIALSGTPDRCDPVPLPAQENWPNDRDYPQLWGHQLIGYRWDVALRSAGVEVAVFDSGVNCRHAELSDQFWSTSSGVGDRSRGDAGRTCPKFAGYDYADMDHDAGHCSANYDKCYGHGTAMAGLIAARANNGIGAIGVAPNALIRSYRVLVTDKQVGPIANFERAILDAHRSGVRILNFSVYEDPPPHEAPHESLHEVCDELDRVSTGPDAALVTILGRQEGTYLVSCAPIAPNVLVVGGVSRMEPAGTVQFKNDTDGAHLYAPGDFVWDGGPDVEKVLNGSSNAVAYVSGAAAQVWGTRAFADCNAHQMRELLLKTARTVTECISDEPIKLLSLAFLPAIAHRSFASCDDAIVEAQKHR